MSRIAKRRLGDFAVVLVSAAFAVILGLLVHQVGVMRQQVEALSQGLQVEQQGVEDAGGTPVAPPPEELIEDPDTEISAEPQGDGGSGPTDEQVYAAVQDYFRTHPVADGKNASPAQIAAAVINYLAENPPAPGEPGPAPTEEQLLNAVGVYLAANPPPPGPPGTDGTDGQDGKDAAPLTSEQIQAELDAYLEAHPLQRCDPGWESTVLTVLTTGLPTEITTCARQEEN